MLVGCTIPGPGDAGLTDGGLYTLHGGHSFNSTHRGVTSSQTLQIWHLLARPKKLSKPTDVRSEVGDEGLEKRCWIVVKCASWVA